MPLSFSEKVRVMLARRNMTLAQVAEITGQSRQNLYNKISRDNFTEKEMIEISKALQCTFETCLTMNDTKETI